LRKAPVAVALLLAAGRGERLGSGLPKAFVPLGGRPMLQWSLDVLASAPEIERIAVAMPPETSVPLETGALPETGVPPSGTGMCPAEVRLPAGVVCVPGGAVRSASVRQALAAVGPGDPVLVHDAARPLLDAGLVRRTLDAVARPGVQAAVAAAAVTDTIKRALGEPPVVSETLDRAGLWAVQTPQVFRREALQRALDVPDDVLAAATDDAWLIERAGGRVVIVPSDPHNLKVTTPTDVALAESLLAGRAD
jgi:2-C-methyl-D-erythritol 4-phosphate cytidylyltransferase